MAETHEQGHVLVIDDDEDFAVSVSDLLGMWDYSSVLANSAEQARGSIGDPRVKVALVDVRIGRDNGIDLLEELRPVRPDVVYVVMTAYSSTDTAVRALHEGAYDYLAKPFDARDLRRTLQRCFDQIRLEAEKTQAERALRNTNAALQRVNERLRMMVGAARCFAACPDETELGRRMLQEFARNMAARGGSLYLCREDHLELAHSLDQGHAPARIDYPLRDRSVFATVIQRREPILVPALGQEGDLDSSGWADTTPIP